jgi:hydrogenase-4 membrane subunit HyfE
MRLRLTKILRNSQIYDLGVEHPVVRKRTQFLQVAMIFQIISILGILTGLVKLPVVIFTRHGSHDAILALGLAAIWGFLFVLLRKKRAYLAPISHGVCGYLIFGSLLFALTPQLGEFGLVAPIVNVVVAFLLVGRRGGANLERNHCSLFWGAQRRS